LRSIHAKDSAKQEMGKSVGEPGVRLVCGPRNIEISRMIDGAPFNDALATELGFHPWHNYTA
jgi:hypothetical protein